MNTRLLKNTLSSLGIITTIIAFGSLKATAETTPTTDDTVTINSNSQVNGVNNDNSLESQQQTPDSTLSLPASSPVEETPTPIQAQTPVVSPGRTTRGGSSYIGVGGNIGITGDTRIGEGSFAVISKVGLTNTLSVRPGALVGDGTVFLLPVTLDFPVQRVTETGETQIGAAPYLGAGVAVSTGRDSTVGFLVSGGVDVPIANQLTANAGVNVSFIDDTDVGILLGVGYNF